MKTLLTKRFLPFILLMSMLHAQAVNTDTTKGKNESGSPDKSSENTVVFYEGFENGMPSGWIQQYLASPYGENVNWEIRTGAGLIDGRNPGEPEHAAVGDKNLVFQWQGVGHRTRIITPPIDLEFIVHPVLEFYYAQVEWDSDEFDQLTIYYRKGENGNWNFLRRYDQKTHDWVHQSIPIDDHDTDKFYFALDGLNNYGFGICVDDFTVIETGYIPKEMNNFTSEQASLDFVPSGTVNNRILRSTNRVTGNTGSVKMQSYTAHSLNTNDADVTGVKLYYTQSELFNTSNLVAQAAGFVNGEVVFDNMNLDLPTGYSYLWLTYDVAQNAAHGNRLDAFIPAGGIIVNGEGWPAANQSPFGNREVYESIFYDDFDEDKEWVLTGEWERAVPTGYGGLFGTNGTNGSSGHPGASHAYVGNKIIGTDITGKGDFPGNYEPDIDTLAYLAISPTINCFYYKDVQLSFHRWLNAETSDSLYIHVSTDAGNTWTQIWVNENFNTALSWSHQKYPIPLANRQEHVKVRFGVGPTDFTNHYSGWNIDNLVITGSFVTKDAGVVKWVGPTESCGMSSQETVVVEVKNFGAAAISEPIPLGFSLDGGATWHMDTLNVPLAIGQKVTHTFKPKADFSTPGRYNKIIVKTFWENDEDNSNDAITHQLFSSPHITPPYSELFLQNDGLWTGYGQNSSWEWSAATGSVMQDAQAGSKAWFTNAEGSYNPLEASWLESPCFNFSSNDYPVIEFYVNTHTPEGVDGLGIEYSADAGASWQPLSPKEEALSWGWHDGETDISSLNSAFASGHGWHGNHAQWQRVRAVLGSDAAHKEKVKFRMIFASHNFDPQTSIWEGIGFDAVSVYEAPYDMGVVALVDPVDACELGVEQSFTVRIENFGLNAIPAGTQVPAGLEVNEEATAFEFFTLTNDLQPGQTTEFTFASTFDVTAKGPHSVVAYTLLPGDTDFYNPGHFNDTLITAVTVFGYPEFVLGQNIYSSVPDTIVLDAGEGFVNYLWNNGSVDQTFAVELLHSAFYTATVTDHYGCSSTDSLEVITRDISIVAITQPVSDCELSDEEYITVKVENTGPDAYAAGTEIPVQIVSNGVLHDELVIILDDALLPGQTISASFEVPYDFSTVGQYSFVLTQTLEDADPSNNILLYDIFVHGYPQPWIGDTLYTQTPLDIILDAGEEYVGFTWQDGFDGQLYEITDPYTAWYNVHVTDVFGCPGKDSVWVVTYDIEIAEIIVPAESCELTDDELLGVRLINHGPETLTAGQSFPFAAEFQGAFLAQDTLVLLNDWPAGEELEFYFSTTIDMQSVQVYEFEVYQLNRDANTGNDSLFATVTVHGYPEIFMPPFVTAEDPQIITLSPGFGHYAYLWHDESTDSVFHAHTHGEHWVKVSNDFGCTSKAVTFVYPEVFDLAVDSIILADVVCAGSDENPVIIQFANTGYMPVLPGTELTFTYNINGNQLAEEQLMLTTQLLPGDVRQYRFQKTFTAPDKAGYEIIGEVSFEYDEIAENNVFLKELPVDALPQPDLGGKIYTPDAMDLELSPGDEYASYLWNDGSTSSTFLVKNQHTDTYNVTVTDDLGCSNTAFVDVVTYNFVMESIISPSSHCELTSSEEVVVKVYNQGYDSFEAGFPLQLGYSLDGTQQLSEEFVLNEPWPVNTFRIFNFSKTANLTDKSNYELRAFVATPNAVAETDSKISHIQITGRPEVHLGENIYTTRPDTIVLNAGAGFASYQWHDGHNKANYPVSSYGWKWVKVTDQYGCVGSDTLYVGFFTQVQEMMVDFSSKVYPNPARDDLWVELDNLPLQGVLVEFLDIRGQLVRREQIDNDAGTKQRFDISMLPSGVYMVSITGKNVRKTHKITVVQ